MSVKDGVFVLYIRNVQREDAGDYICEVSSIKSNTKSRYFRCLDSIIHFKKVKPGVKQYQLNLEKLCITLLKICCILHSLKYNLSIKRSFLMYLLKSNFRVYGYTIYNQYMFSCVQLRVDSPKNHRPWKTTLPLMIS